MPSELTLQTIYVALSAIAIGVEHRLIFRKWRRNELARWGLGIGTILSLGALFVFLGAIEFRTWAVIATAFGMAAVVRYLMAVNESEGEAEKKARELRERILHGTEETKG